MSFNPRPWLSVVMPAYRGEKWIGRAFDSLVTELTPDVEVIVIDGSDTADTRDIARSYSDRLRVRIVERQDLSTWHAKTNFAVRLAEAPHVSWLGVDDVWFPGRLAAVRKWIAAAPEAALHLAPTAIIDEEGKRLGIWRCPFAADRELSSAAVTALLLIQNFIAAPAPVFRKDGWLNCGGLDADLWYTADWDIWLKLAALGPILYHRDVTIGFRVHRNSLTMSGLRNIHDFEQQMHLVLDRHLFRCDDRSKNLERIARASIAVNTALASASMGNFSAMPSAALQVLRLGPTAMCRYVRDSRIAERVLPRVRARLRGAL